MAIEEQRLFPERTGEVVLPDVTFEEAMDGPLLVGSEALAGFSFEGVSGEIFGRSIHDQGFGVVFHDGRFTEIEIGEDGVQEARKHFDSDKDTSRYLAGIALRAHKTFINS